MEFLVRVNSKILVVLAVLMMVAGCSKRYRLDRETLAVESAWPFHRGGLASIGALPDGSFDGRLDVVWEEHTKSKPVGPLTIYHDHLVYPDARNKIRFLDAASGEFRGRIKPKGTPQTGLVAADNLAFYAIGPRHNRLKCVNLRSGKEQWTRRFNDASPGAIVVDNRLIIGSSNGVLLALEPETGKVVWHFTSESMLTVPASFGDGKIVQPGDDGNLYVLSSQDGSEIFRTRLGGELVSPAAVSDKIYIGDISGSVYGIDLSTGAIAWETKLKGPVWTSPAVAGGRLYVGHSAGELVALDAATGHVLWTHNTVDVIRASAIVAGKYVVVGTMTGKVYSLDAATGQIVSQRELDGPIFTAPVTDGERVFVATEKGYITCFGRPLAADDTLSSR